MKDLDSSGQLIDSGESWLGAVPRTWTASRIRSVALLSPGYSSSAPGLDEECTVVPMELLSDEGTIDVSMRRRFEDVQPGLTLFESNDVIFAKITPCMENGKGAFVQRLPTRYGFGSTEFHVLRPSHSVDGKFLYYATYNTVFRAFAAENMTGAAGQKRVSSRFLEDTRLFLPRIEEQRQIVSYLDAMCLALDAVKDAKRKQLQSLDGVRRDIIQCAVTRGLEHSQSLRPTGNVWMKEVPVGWELVSLKRISSIQTGLTLGKEYEGRLIERPYLRVANVQDGRLDLGEITTIEVPEQVANRVELRPNDVLMTEGGDLDKLGRGTIWTGEIPRCLHQNHIFAIRCFTHKLLPEFLAYITVSQYGRDYFEATGKRTTNLANTNSTKVGLLPIPRPPIAVQKEICQFLDTRLAEIGRVTASIEAQIDTLSRYRESAIHECVTGKRRITEKDISRIPAYA